MKRTFFITSTAYSATRYAAKVFTAVGLPCFHEYIRPTRFNIPIPEPKDMSPWFQKRTQDLDMTGDCSYHIASLLDKIPTDIPIFHLVRDPIKTMNTLSRCRFMHVDPTNGWGSRSAKLLEERGFPFKDRADQFKCVISYWCGWHQMIMKMCEGRPYHRFRVEDVCPDMMVKVYEALGLQPPRGVVWIQQRIDSVSRVMNHHAGSGEELFNKDNIPDEAIKLANFFGYVIGPEPNRMERTPQSLLTTDLDFK